MIALARRTLVAVVLLAATSASAQMQSRPTDPPLVSAAGESWYQLREPLVIGSDLYYPAGASVFFNGHVMVRAGHYNGVPLYVDATLEPYSVLFVPIGRGSMQPYERPRRGALAGSSGSRLSAFPVRLAGDPGAAGPGVAVLPMTAVSPTQVPVSLGAMVSFTPEPLRLPPLPSPSVVPDVAAAAAVPAVQFSFTPQVIITSSQPQSNDGVWVQYDNQRWVSGGRAEIRTADFTQVGTYGAFPVFRRVGGPIDVVYLPTREGVVAPYRRKG
jgi:hypothetical protein